MKGRSKRSKPYGNFCLNLAYRFSLRQKLKHVVNITVFIVLIGGGHNLKTCNLMMSPSSNQYALNITLFISGK